jgi:hypothetical protein
MYKIDYSWKNFNLNLNKITEELKELDANCLGIQGCSVMEVYFSEEPSEQTKTAIQAYWDGLTDQSVEATSYKSSEDIADQVTALKADAVTKSYDQLSTIQKKLLLNISFEINELFE